MKNPFKQQRRDGAAAIEFALTFPLLLLLIFGAYELSRANMVMQTTESAAYEGTRVAIIPGATEEEAIAAAEDVLATAGIRNAKISVNPKKLKKDSETVSVTVKVKFDDNFFLAPFFMGKEPFVRSCELIRERL